MDEPLEVTDQLTEFDLAFEAAAAADNVKVELPTDNSQPVEENTAQKEPPAQDEPVVPAAPPEPVVVPPAPTPAAPQSEPVVKPVEQPSATPPVPEPEPLPKGYEFTEEEQAIFDNAVSMYPEAGALFSLLEKKLTETRNATRLYDLNAAIQQALQQMEPVVAEASKSARTRWESTVLDKHKDAFIILPKVEEWVSKQPTILQAAYNQVLDRGTAEQTIELLDLVKKSPEFAPPAPPATTTPPQNQEIEKQLDSQEGIRSRSTVNRGTILDPNDFDGAFDRFAANGK